MWPRASNDIMDKLREYYAMIEDIMFRHEAFSYPIYIWAAGGGLVILTLLLLIPLINLVSAIWRKVARSLEKFHNKFYSLAENRDNRNKAKPQSKTKTGGLTEAQKVKQLKEEIKGLQSAQQKKNREIQQLEDEVGRLRVSQKENNKTIKQSKDEIGQLRSAQHERNEVVQQLKDENGRLARELHEKNTIIHQSNDDIGRLMSAQDESNEVMQHLKNENGRLRTELQEKNDLVKKYATRLSQEMNHKVSADESNVENVSIKNRPMNVAENYETLCSDAWLTAKEALDRKVEDESFKVEYIFRILMCANHKMEELYQLYWCQLQELFTKPSAALSHPTRISPQPAEGEFDLGKLGLPNALLNAVSDFLRNNDDLDELDLQRSTQEVLKQVEEDWGATYHSSLMELCKSEPSITNYALSCLRFCWKMVLQRPKMRFKVTEHYAGPDCQDLYWTSVDPALRQAYVVKHVYPMVYHGKNLMKKGKVLLTPCPMDQ